MNKFIISSLILLTCSFLYSQKDPVVMTVNGNPVTKSEFLQVYLKNNAEPSFEKEALDEYIELYKKFKLKVSEAKALEYDTIPRLKNELAGYRKQLARPYLVDSAKNLELVKEAYERSKYEINASHILVQVKENASPEDTLKAHNKIMKLKERIEAGEDFGEVAASKKGSEDPSAVDNKGNLGYFTAFQMVYPFENIAYKTPEGEIGGPIRTKYGYHLVKVHDKRPARGTMIAAHIMVAAPKNADQSDLKNAKLKIDEIHTKLKAGEDFNKMAKLYSDDRGTKDKGGRLPAFGSGTSQRMVPEFEDAAFKLKQDNEFSEPFKTDYGYHIVRRVSYEPLGTYDELKKSLQNKVNRGERGQQTQKSFIDKLKKENKFKDKSDKRMEWFNENVDSSIYKGGWKAPVLNKDRWMFKYDGEKYTQSQFKDYLLENQRKGKRNPLPVFIAAKYKDWQKEVIIDNEKSKLEDKYPEFKALLQEYEDGVLLYEIMKDKVWDKAVKDTTGLKDYFQKNQANYNWPERIQATVYSSDKKEMIDSTWRFVSNQDTLSPKEVIELVNSESQLNVSLKEDKFVHSEVDYLKGRLLKTGPNKPYEHDGKFYIVSVNETLKAGPKSLREARGAAIQDYQNHLEETWLEELRQKHEIKVNEEVLYSVGK